MLGGIPDLLLPVTNKASQAMSFHYGKGSNRPAQGYLLCMTPLKLEHLEFPPCNVRGKIEGKSAEMVVDSGCTRTLVHERFAKNGALWETK